MGRVVVAGSINIDLIACTERHPEAGETVRASRNGVMLPLTLALHSRVAKELCAVVPTAERVKLTRSGSEAVSAAVR